MNGNPDALERMRVLAEKHATSTPKAIDHGKQKTNTLKSEKASNAGEVSLVEDEESEFTRRMTAATKKEFATTK